MSDASVQQIATALTDLANNRSGSDNVTVVVYQHT
jgi:serine/threonine protein phosphatase PrpC